MYSCIGLDLQEAKCPQHARVVGASAELSWSFHGASVCDVTCEQTGAHEAISHWPARPASTATCVNVPAPHMCAPHSVCPTHVWAPSVCVLHAVSVPRMCVCPMRFSVAEVGQKGCRGARASTRAWSWSRATGAAVARGAAGAGA
eukprot:361615-Chlamydomonas_euryale.AAC.1